MFELKSSFNIGNISSFSDGYSSSLKLVKFLDDNTIIIVENTSDSYYFYKISINGDILYKSGGSIAKALNAGFDIVKHVHELMNK